MDGISGNLPFTITELDNREIARSALESGEVAIVILFPADFSKLAVSDKNFSIEIWNTQHLTVAETQMASQLPMMIQMALSAGVANLRLAMSKSQMPSLDLTVTANVETLYRGRKYSNPSSSIRYDFYKLACCDGRDNTTIPCN